MLKRTGLLLLAALSVRASAAVPYEVVPEDARWDVALGHHRARVDVVAPALAVQLHVPWRLPLSGMETRALIVHDPEGQRVSNVVRVAANREAADLVFEAKRAGTYALYYLAYAPVRGWGGCQSRYEPWRETADPAWQQRVARGADLLAAEAWRTLPAARVVAFQARSAFDRFDPMEVIATAAERTRLLARNERPFLLFPEDRRHPIRMRADLPQHWMERGPSLAFDGTAQQNEYYAFQVGVFAPSRVLDHLVATPTDLRGPAGARIPAGAVTCFNTDGIDTWGRPFRKSVQVPAGHVQPLWLGVDVAPAQPPGLYEGAVAIGADGVPAQTVAVRIAVAAGALPDRGDGDLWRHSRLRWLNSSVGLNNDLIRPYTPLRVAGMRVECLGRSVTLGRGGLPERVCSGSQEVLAAPARFVVETQRGPLAFPSDPPQFTDQEPGRVAWRAEARASAATVTCRGEMSFDGRLLYFVTLKAGPPLDLRDVRLELPYRVESATYQAGIGVAGGARPAQTEWHWQGPFDSFWLGDVPAGLHCELRGGSYHGPMLNLYHPAPPPTWGNGGKGGVTIREQGGQVLATAFSGPRSLRAGEEITFEFALLATPVKPLAPAAHFQTRYFHGNTERTPLGINPDPPAAALAAGVNVVNVHHATTRNPYINYPFRANERIRELTDAMHARDVKVKLYYTLRELSNYVEELWALRSLGDEVIAPGGGGGFAWLQEHLGTGYQPAWYSPFPDGSADAAFVNTGESRWYNYYIEGLGWMVEHLGIDGLYLDDVSYDRHVLQRMRRVMDRVRPGCLLDLHSNTGFSIGPVNQYLEFFPYLDRLWFGESFNYHAMTPDQWLVQVSGIPFGVMGEMLHAGGQAWRGPLYGMTTRLGWSTEGTTCDPREVWKVWDRVGLAGCRMLGYWATNCPVRSSEADVPATVYTGAGRSLIALASWAPARKRVRLTVDWPALGLDPARARLHAPRAEGFQPAAEFAPGDEIPVPPGRGWLLVVDEEPPAPDAVDPLAACRPVYTDNFTQPPAAAGWRSHVSPQPGTDLTVREGALAIRAAANHTAFLERVWPATATAVACTVESGSDQGESWGPGITLVWPDGAVLRFYVRSREQRFGLDVGAEQRFAGTAPRGSSQVLRIRLGEAALTCERQEDGLGWETLGTIPRTGFAGAPSLLRIGKVAHDGRATDYTTAGASGELTIRDVRIW